MDKNFATAVWPHGAIKEIFPDLFYVTGTNITVYDGVEYQHSRNMIIIREGNKLSLVNTVRLNEAGLSALDKLGKVQNIVRIGSFHGRDDAFYLNRYQASLWALPGMQHENNRQADVELLPGGPMPVADCSLFLFTSSKFPEGILCLAEHDGVLVTCDSLKNWEAADEFFSPESAKLYAKQGFFAVASISDVWLQATGVDLADFERLKTIPFKHLISAHGQPLLNTAYGSVMASIKRVFT